MTKHIVVITTTSKKDEAQRLAATLVERKLAACVQIVGPIESTYRWQGKIETASELLLLIKTTSELWSEVAKTIRELHSYQTPEIIALPITAGSAEYL